MSDRASSPCRARGIVETLDTTVDAELGALPVDMRARFIRIAELIETAGLPRVHGPHVKWCLAFIKKTQSVEPQSRRAAKARKAS